MVLVGGGILAYRYYIVGNAGRTVYLWSLVLFGLIGTASALYRLITHTSNPTRIVSRWKAGWLRIPE